MRPVVIPKRKSLPKPALIGLLVLGALIIVLGVLDVAGVTHIIRKPAPKQLTITAADKAETTTNKPAPADTPASPTTPNAPPVTPPSVSGKDPSSGGQSGGPVTPSSAPLTEPSGTFVSNHLPGQNGSPTQETSTCITTPSATCSIKFTMGSYERTLAAKTVGSDNTASWTWNIADYQFPAGKWQITAIATLNGQTKTTVDPQPLEIK